jgi:hypothetical protein
VFIISTPFPWIPLQLHSNSTPWSGNGVEFQKLNGVGIKVCRVGVEMELEILNFSETSFKYFYELFNESLNYVFESLKSLMQTIEVISHNIFSEIFLDLLSQI